MTMDAIEEIRIQEREQCAALLEAKADELEQTACHMLREGYDAAPWVNRSQVILLRRMALKIRNRGEGKPQC